MFNFVLYSLFTTSPLLLMLFFSSYFSTRHFSSSFFFFLLLCLSSLVLFCFDFLSYLFISYHFISFIVISYHFISFLFLLPQIYEPMKIYLLLTKLIELSMRYLRQEQTQEPPVSFLYLYIVVLEIRKKE